MDSVHPMATQLAQLISASDVDELREIVRRWVATAGTEAERQRYHELGARILELKAAFQSAGMSPSREELELMLTTMFAMALEADPETVRRRGPAT